MVAHKINPKGIYSAIISPLSSDGGLDEKVLKQLVHFELAHGVEGFYCCGSSGEGLLLSDDERKRLVEIVVGESGGSVPVLAHVGSLSTRSAITLARHAEKTGVSAVSAIPPIYYKYTQAEINQYYQDIIDSVSLGVIVYNIPQFTGISFTTENPLLKNEKIIGIKHTSMNLYDLERIGREHSDKILINGHDEIYVSAMAAGATAIVGTTVNIFPKLFVKIRQAFVSGKMDEARALQHRLNDAIEVFVNTNIFSAAKYAMEIQGVPVGLCRKPFIELTPAQKKLVKEAVEKLSDIL